jgi:hypothetical protein
MDMRESIRLRRGQETIKGRGQERAAAVRAGDDQGTRAGEGSSRAGRRPGEEVWSACVSFGQ